MVGMSGLILAAGLAVALTLHFRVSPVDPVPPTAAPPKAPRTAQPDVNPSPERRLDRRLTFLRTNEQGYREYQASDSSVLIHIPAGEFVGSVRPADKTVPGLVPSQQKLKLGGYLIGRHEVTVGQFKRFVAETGFRPKLRDWADLAEKSGDSYPVVYISWDAAMSYGRWAGHRLPSLAEWERAARGTHGQAYPWGAKWEANRCNTWELSRKEYTDRMAPFSRQRGPVPVGLIREGASPCGAMDMAGNVMEWCGDDDGEGDAATDPHGIGFWHWRLLLGGSWDDFQDRCCLSPPRFVRSPDYTGGTYAWGFRVVRDDVPEERDR